MKRVRNLITALGAAALSIVLALGFNACSQQSPLSPAADSGSLNKGVQIVRYQEAPQSGLNKVVPTSQMITVQDGGQLSIDATNTNGSRIQVTLDVVAASISQDAQLSMALDDELLMVSFNIPAGVTFSQAPVLTIVAAGLPTASISSGTLGVYVENNGQWQLVSQGSVTSSGSMLTGLGTIGGGATTDSRYAIGAE